MRRCVRLEDETGRCCACSSTEDVHVAESDTFMDLFARVAPSVVLQRGVACVRLKQSSQAPDTGATDARDLGANVCNFVAMIRMSEGYDPTVITFVVPSCSARSQSCGARRRTDAVLQHCSSSTLLTISSPDND